MTRKLAVLAFLFVAAACTPPIVTTQPQEPIQVGFYSVTPQIEWNRPMMTIDETWTVDGFGLQALRFFAVPHGQQLFQQYSMFGKAQEPDEKTPVFRQTMIPNEIQDFLVETLSVNGWASVKPAGLAPAKFGDLPGFRFSFSMLDEDGLAFDGMTIGAVKDGTLHMIVYIGTHLHYFPKHQKDVEKLFASIRT